MNFETLKRSPVFARLSDEGLRAASRYFTPRKVDARSPVWFEGQEADEMAVVVEGALTVRIGVQAIGAVAAGELVGETSAFLGDRRVATVVATEATQLIVIAREALADLRSGHAEIYDRLLDRSLAATARRVQQTGTRIALLGNGGSAPPERKNPPSLLRLIRMVDGGETRNPAPLLPVLRGLPVLRSAGADIQNRVARAFAPRRIQKDEAIFLEGEPGNSAFIVTEGNVDVIRNVRGGRARRLALLAGGAVFGTGSLLLGERRNASCVARSEGWIWEMPRPAHDALLDEGGRCWRESLLAALRFQVQEAGNSLATLQGGTTWEEKEKLRRTAERLVSFRAGELINDPFTFRGRGAP